MQTPSELHNQIRQEIALCERSALGQLSPPPIEPASLLAGHVFGRVEGIAKPSTDDRPIDLHRQTVDFVIGAHGIGGYLTFVLTETPSEVGVYLSLDSFGTAKRLLSGAYPGITLEMEDALSLLARLESRFEYCGMMTGIPSSRNPGDEERLNHQRDNVPLERIVRGMRGSTWAYVVQAYPRSCADVVADRQSVLDKIAGIASVTRQQVQRSIQASSAKTSRQTETTSEMMGGEIVNRQAEYAVELMERELKRLESALATGRWQVAVYFGATQQATAHHLAALLNGVVAGPGSRPEPVRMHFCSPASRTSSSQFNTYLSSEELALLVQLPQEEAPGYAVSDLAHFDVDIPLSRNHGIRLGSVEWDGHETDSVFELELADFTRHGVVFGVTGSGKTTTMMGILDQLWNATEPVPFLVIEPAKTEYRSLLGKIKNGSPEGRVRHLRVFTLGNDTVAPFRLNPFEFELSDRPGGAFLLPHIDFLKAVFNAAFILYAPMPYVLETALHEIYEDKGWSLATGKNIRLADQAWVKRDQFPIFPTLSDLYDKVEAVARRLGYEKRIEQDVVAGLRARIGALRLGSKGLMLDTPRGMPMSELLKAPTVLELENIGNDDEKSFLMGLFLARLYEYRRLQAIEGRMGKGLRHVLVVEEAHRLLKNVTTTVDTESSNLRAQAIETFVNMLSEVRHYGQGILVAEQIPTKLTPDVIKNSNLKLIHRVNAADDREILASATNMTESQQRHLATLVQGQVVAYAEGEDHPLLLRVEDYKAAHGLAPPLDEHLSRMVSKATDLSRFLTVTDFGAHGLRADTFGRPDPLVFQAALRFLGHRDNQALWAQILARTVFSREKLPETLTRLRQQIASDPGHLTAGQFADALVMLVLLGADRALQKRGKDRATPYPEIETMRVSISTGLTTLLKTDNLQIATSHLDRFVRSYEPSLRREWGPYPGCKACRSVCFYHPEVTRLLSAVDYGFARSTLANQVFDSQQARFDQIAKDLQSAVRRWLGGSCGEASDIAYCAGLVIGREMGLEEYEQEELGQGLERSLRS